MQVQDEKKRQRIIQAAGKLFAQRQFHKVCLDEVASEAGVGKGTVYTYFSSKDDLYLSLLEHALGQLVDLLEQRVDADPHRPADRSLSLIVRELVDYAAGHPYLFELMRAGTTPLDRPEWIKRRQALRDLIERVLRRGVDTGQFNDANPQITALFIPGLVRSAMLGSTRDRAGIDRKQLSDHILRFIHHGLTFKEAS